MKRTTIQVGTFCVNCTILSADGSAWLVDPGGEADRILALLAEKRLTPAGILLTHAHFDHVGGIPALQKAFPDLPVFVHPDDIPAFTHPANQFPPDYPPIARPRHVRSVGLPLDCTVMHTPGHTPGGVCYHFPNDGILLSGDTLFAGSVGRTDLPGGDMAALRSSLERLKDLPPDTVVIPGHGAFTTIGDERAGNPFLQ